MSSDPESIIQRQLDAYNAHDVERFVAAYSDGAELFLHPDRLLARGTEQIRARYATRFAANKPRAVILKRITLGNTVIDEEEITAISEGIMKVSRAVAIYEVREGKIARAWFVS